ncbi:MULTISPECIES: bifunctional 3'-5' exonuclease/DNA polymerase [unclassified Pseudoclavibacter]|uniref:bifunctional 3'-5' exonuclease/DNA polymerase n=1 Tax=unclassified Pseudoclavibacter TaxID=2615177 RepID=UPI000CE7214E|nr:MULTISPECIES: bifunctional 3'-5' exonuclease/DNA polymerase [unclassified Pseudoclavibacter]PPF35276.1 bifunctional 3'-5' exonuclease/DNA polymerase [Pseudoclavibacter sp. AY1H1]PPF78060.1 bifunctional 3'-5' exonuclease/DNA polymerase [Pseudoclavibacter sp. Z016]
MHILVTSLARGFALEDRRGPADGDEASAPVTVPDAIALAQLVSERERSAPPSDPIRWVWNSQDIVPRLLAHGVRVGRCHDLRLAGRILITAGYLDARFDVADARGGSHPGEGLFDLDAENPGTPEATRRLFDAQLAGLEASDQEADRKGALAFLVGVESAGALVAAELRAAGMPFSVERHEGVLVEALGARGTGGRPAKLEAAASAVRAALGEATLNVDSPKDLLAALRRAGLDVASTSKWELVGKSHPVVDALLHYKRLHRLFTANGWTWREEWIHGGRFRPDYVPGGVVTGRWATSGGGAMQLPKEIRSAVVADTGWKLVVADAAQLEPRILAAMSGDEAMARAGAQRDMYAAFVDRGVVPDRDSAKVAMLGAMYGATTGQSAVLLPGLERAFPHAMGLVASAARSGERGQQVQTWLGRTSPWPPAEFSPRDFGRFTRNFIVQGTAAEWALTWMAGIRQRLAALGSGTGDPRGTGSVADAPLERTAHLAYFLHDEVVVHAPAEHAERAAAEVIAAAAEAGRFLFAGSQVTFPVVAHVVDSYGEAK